MRRSWSIIMVCFARFFILLPLTLICVFFVFANDDDNHHHDDVSPDSTKTNDKKIVVVNKTELQPEVPGSIATNKELVEVTDAMEDEEEENGLAYTPAIAPATPQVLIVTQSVHKDDEVLRGKPVENDLKAEVGTTSSSKQKTDEFITNKKLIINDIHGNEERKSLISYSSIVSTSTVDTALSTSSISQQSVETHLDSSIQVRNDIKQEEKTRSNSNEDDEKVHSDKKTKKDSKITDSSLKMVSIENKNQQLPPSNKNSDDIVQDNTSSHTNESHTDISKQEKAEPLLNGVKSNVDEIDPSNTQKNDGKEPVSDQLQDKIHGLSQENSKSKEVVMTSMYSESITPDISSVISIPHVIASENKTYVDKDIKEGLDKDDTEKSIPVDNTNVAPSPTSSEVKYVEESQPPPIDKLISFAEWKKRLDKENKEKVDEDIVDSNSPTPKNKTSKEKMNKKHKIRKNFAAIDCGGKVVQANEEASNILSVLKEDKDAYMLNPCNVRAWFVVELCDSIRVESIDLANFEMFSSTPETFNVYVTKRYPSGSWEKVGTFHAKHEKVIQTFTIEEKFYAKFIKIEIKKYFGTEHYCPLSLFRVHGISEFEDEEDNDDQDNTSEETNIDDQDNVTTEPIPDANTANIFEAAKNVVADLVHGMAKKLSGKSNSEVNESGISKHDDVKNSVVVTVTAISKDSVSGELDSSYYHKDSILIAGSSVDWEMWYYYRQPKRTCSVTDFRSFIKKLKATVYFNYNNTNNLNNMLQSVEHPAKSTPLQNIAITPHLATASITSSGKNINVSVLRSDVTLSEIQKATQTIDKVNIKDASVATPSLEGIPNETSAVVEPSEVSRKTSSTSKPNIIVNTVLPNNSIVSSQASSKQPIYEESVDVLEFKVNESLKGAVIAEKYIPNVDAEVTQNKTVSNETLVSSEEEKLQHDTKDISGSDSNVNDSTVETPVDKTDLNNNGSELKSDGVVEQSALVGSKNSLEPAKPVSVSSDEVDDNTSTVEVVASPQAKSTEKKSDIMEPSASKKNDSQTSAGKTTSGGSKESIIAKLNAKVKALQANLTMSMMYLDEMSEQYRTAVEEVDERHKKKNQALNMSIQQQQGVIKHQTNLIANLTKQISELAFQIQNLTKTTQDQHQKIIETHATWVFLEITIILIFLLLCRSKPRSYNDEISDEMDRHRRFSEPSLLKNKDMWTLDKPPVRKQLSDPTGISDNLYSNSNQLQIAKKRKRKKKLNVSEIEMNIDKSIPGSTEKAGLIFGRGLFNGIAGAFIKKKDTPQKLSRQADALLDDVSDTSCCNITPLRKVRSSELPTIDEDKLEDITVIARPKSCGYLDESFGFRKYNKNSQRAAGRFG